MRASEWFAAIAAHDDAIRIQHEVAGLYEARGTAFMCAAGPTIDLLINSDAGRTDQLGSQLHIAPCTTFTCL